MFGRDSTARSNAFGLQKIRAEVRSMEIHVGFYSSMFRIRGLIKVKTLHEQVASMEKVVAQTKTNKDQIQKQVQQLKQRVDQLIKEITVSDCSTKSFESCLKSFRQRQ